MQSNKIYGSKVFWGVIVSLLLLFGLIFIFHSSATSKIENTPTMNSKSYRQELVLSTFSLVTETIVPSETESPKSTNTYIPVPSKTKEPVSTSTITPVPPTTTIPVPTKTPLISTPTKIETDSFNDCNTYSSGTVTCKIRRAYCLYESSETGQPTFCDDAPYPSNSFTYVVWGHNVSFLNGHCIIVYGNIEYYDRKPEISWQNNNGFVKYCD